MTASIRTVLSILAGVLLAFLVVAGPAAAQAGSGALGSQSFRPYAHVFIAYALAWLLVLGWAWSIARRLGRVERQLER